MIRDACEKRGFRYKLSFTEYGIKGCYLNYNEMLIDFKKNKFDGVAFYSLAQLPEKKNLRNNLYKIIKLKNKKILFSLENILVSDEKDIKNIEQLVKLKFLIKKSPKKL